jgi:hypothetical protein
MAFDHLILKNSTSRIIEVPLRSSTTGQLLTGKVHTDMTIDYKREGSTPVAVTEVSGTNNTFVSGGWVESSRAGIYEFSIPDLALASGADAVTITFSATGAIDVVKRIILTSIDIQDAADLGLTTLTGHTPQTGDSYARIGANGAGLTAVVAASVTGAVGSVTGAVGSVTGSIGSLGVQAKADVNAEADTALADYDAPTNA